MSRILVTGAADWPAEDLDTITAALMTAWIALDKSSRPVLVHSGARGAEALAVGLWRCWGWPVERTSGQLSADLCLAFPLPSSTRERERQAHAAGIPVRVHGPLAQPHRSAA